jgi:hypothetical protein
MTIDWYASSTWLWIILIILLLLLLAVFIVFLVYSFNVPSWNSGIFEFTPLTTTRHNNTLLTINLKLIYNSGIQASKIPVSSQLLTTINSELADLTKNPITESFEILAQNIGNSIWDIYPVQGLSIQLVENTFSSSTPEPTDTPIAILKAIYSKGNVIPLT